MGHLQTRGRGVLCNNVDHQSLYCLMTTMLFPPLGYKAPPPYSIVVIKQFNSTRYNLIQHQMTCIYYISTNGENGFISKYTEVVLYSGKKRSCYSPGVANKIFEASLCHHL